MRNEIYRILNDLVKASRDNPKHQHNFIMDAIDDITQVIYGSDE